MALCKQLAVAAAIDHIDWQDTHVFRSRLPTVARSVVAERVSSAPPGCVSHRSALFPDVLFFDGTAGSGAQLQASCGVPACWVSAAAASCFTLGEQGSVTLFELLIVWLCPQHEAERGGGHRQRGCPLPSKMCDNRASARQAVSAASTAALVQRMFGCAALRCAPRIVLRCAVRLTLVLRPLLRAAVSCSS
jgi:hypothetical protein